jgi:hypothetical protein
MYSNADIDALSVGQLRKLLKGGAVRVRCGSGMKVGLSAPQHKKLMSAHKKGKMMTLTMDPYQMEMHGQGLFGDIGNFFTRKLPSTLIHQGLPAVGSTLGKMGGVALAPEIAPISGAVGSQLGYMAGKKLADETGRRTGYGVKKGRGVPIKNQKFSPGRFPELRVPEMRVPEMLGRGQPIEDQQFSLSDIARTGKRMFGRGQPIEDQQFSLSDVARTVKRMSGRGQPIEDQQFSLSDVARTGKRLFGGKVMKGKGAMTDMLKKLAKETAMKMAKKAGSKVLHQALPMASERLGEMAGEYAGVAGGKDAGRMLGQMLENEIAARTGLGMKMKRGRPRKSGGALFVAGAR